MCAKELLERKTLRRRGDQDKITRPGLWGMMQARTEDVRGAKTTAAGGTLRQAAVAWPNAYAAWDPGKKHMRQEKHTRQEKTPHRYDKRGTNAATTDSVINSNETETIQYTKKRPLSYMGHTRQHSTYHSCRLSSTRPCRRARSQPPPSPPPPRLSTRPHLPGPAAPPSGQPCRKRRRPPRPPRQRRRQRQRNWPRRRPRDGRPRPRPRLAGRRRWQCGRPGSTGGRRCLTRKGPGERAGRPGRRPETSKPTCAGECVGGRVVGRLKACTSEPRICPGGGLGARGLAELDR